MSDFAAAAMLRVIRLGLRRLGIAWPAAAASVRARGAHLPLADKRALVDGLLAEHGPQVLLSIGQGALDSQEEPTMLALLLARDPADLITRWQRLERFVHTRHRVRAEQLGSGHALLRHVSVLPGQPPSVAEDLLVLGLLVALMQRLGASALRAHLVDLPGVRWQRGKWHAPALPADASRWSLQWQAPASAVVAQPAMETDWVARAQRLLGADLGRRWTVQALASDMHCSPRSLQRHLAAGDSGFGVLLLAVRLAHSARLLAQTARPPAEIGYLCGFADQAHFTREFKRHSALTPLHYRRQFGMA